MKEPMSLKVESSPATTGGIIIHFQTILNIQAYFKRKSNINYQMRKKVVRFYHLRVKLKLNIQIIWLNNTFPHQKTIIMREDHQFLKTLQISQKQLLYQQSFLHQGVYYKINPSRLQKPKLQHLYLIKDLLYLAAIKIVSKHNIKINLQDIRKRKVHQKITKFPIVS